MSAQSHIPDVETRPGPRRRRLDSATRRATILEAAVPVFATAGYEQTRVSDIAAHVGVTEPVIFQNFGTKAELFASVLDHVSEQAIAHLSGLAVQHENVIDWLHQLLAAEHLDHLHTVPMFGVLFEDAHRLHFEPDVSAALQRTVARVADALAAILERGQTCGSIRNDVPSISLAWLVVSLIQARQFRRRFGSQNVQNSQTLEDDLLRNVVATFSQAAITALASSAAAGSEQ